MAAVLCLSTAVAAVETTERRPNILFALADDWGWPHAPAYGDKVAKTPTFERLAREGVLFTSAYVSSPSCTPSRNAILTGQQFYRLGEAANLWSALDVKYPNFMRLLQATGYDIGHWRKAWGPGNHAAGGYREHPCGPESSFEEFMDRRDRSKPFCFWLGTGDPHRPFETGSGRKNGVDVNAIQVPGFLPDTEAVRSDLADYYHKLERWDRDVGAALALLERAGELENTIIVMTGDNGAPFPRAKGHLYDWGSRAPLAIRWGKQVKAGQRVADFVSFTDFAPTFLAAAQVPIPREMTGESLLPLLTGADSPGGGARRDFVVFGRERHAVAQKAPSMDGYPSRAIRTDRWLMIMNFAPERWPAGAPSGAAHPMGVHPDCDDGPTKRLIVEHRDEPAMRRYYDLCFGKRPAVELYDCAADPEQRVNLAGDAKHSETVDTLRRQLTDYLIATGDPRLGDDPASFDRMPYRAPYLGEGLRKQGFELSAEQAKWSEDPAAD